MLVEILQTISIILLGSALFRLSKSVESLYSGFLRENPSQDGGYERSDSYKI